MVQNIHLPDCFIKEKKYTKLDNNCQSLAKIDEMVLSKGDFEVDTNDQSEDTIFVNKPLDMICTKGHQAHNLIEQL